MVLHPHHQLLIAEAHAEGLRRATGASRSASSNARHPGSVAESTIVIRPSRPEDERALARLAALDSARVPAEPLLLVEAGGELRAALSLHDRRAIADPFHHTRALVELLSARADQLLHEPSGGRRRLRLGRRSRSASWNSAPGASARQTV